jgi:hypothetical protein
MITERVRLKYLAQRRENDQPCCADREEELPELRGHSTCCRPPAGLDPGTVFANNNS